MAGEQASSGSERDLALARAALEIARARDLPDVMRIARTSARELTGADGATLVLREGDECRYADEDAIGPLWKGHRFALTSCISGWVMLHDQPVAIGDIYADPRVPHEAYRSTFVKSLSMVPIRRGEPMGAIGCYWARQNGARDDALAVQQVLADAVALAFESMEMRRRMAVARARAADVPREPPQNGDARYRLLVEQAPDGIFVTDGDGQFLETNEAGARMLGYSHEELLMRCIADVVVPEEIPRVPAEVARVAGGSVVTSEWRLLRKDGTAFPGEVVARRLPDGRLQGILRDLSEHRRAVAALRESESFYRQSLESIPGMVFTTGTDGQFDYVSRQWADYTGAPMTAFQGDGWNALLHAEDRTCALAAWRSAVVVRAPYDLEFRVRRCDGAYEWFYVIARPIRDAHGGVVRWFGVATNIERLKRVEEERVAAITRQRDALVREVHHRIKNHLQGVSGLLRGAIMDFPLATQPLERALAQLQVIANAHGLQGQNLDDSLPLLEMLDFAAASAVGPVRVAKLGITQHTRLAVASTHAVAIALVVNELITNAIKHRELSVASRPADVIVEAGERTVRIVVRNGPARLPPQFDFARREGIGNGLELAASLLPSRGANLLVLQNGENVEAALTLDAPVLAIP